MHRRASRLPPALHQRVLPDSRVPRGQAGGCGEPVVGVQTPHPRATHARTRGIKFPISRSRAFGPPVENENTRTYSFSSHIGPLLFSEQFSLPILKQPVRAVEVLPAEYCVPPAVGLMRDTAGSITAFFAHCQAISHHSGKVDHGRKIIDRHTVRAFLAALHRLHLHLHEHWRLHLGTVKGCSQLCFLTFTSLLIASSSAESRPVTHVSVAAAPLSAGGRRPVRPPVSKPPRHNRRYNRASGCPAGAV